MTYAFPRLYRRVLFWLAILFTARALTAATVTASYTGTSPAAAATLTVTYDQLANKIVWNWTANRTTSGTHAYCPGVWLYRVASNGDQTWSLANRIFDVSITSGSQTGGSNFTPVAGAWYGFAARVLDQVGSTNTVVAGPDVKWIQATQQWYCRRDVVKGPMYSDVTGPMGTKFYFRYDRHGETIDMKELFEPDTPYTTDATPQWNRTTATLEALNLDSDDPIQIWFRASYSVSKDPNTGIWKFGGAGYTEWELVATVTPWACTGDNTAPSIPVAPGSGGISIPPAPGSPTPPPGTTGQGSPPSGSANSSPASGNSGTVWNNQGGTGGVDSNTFQEGTGKLEKQLQEANAHLAKIEDSLQNMDADPNGAAIAQAATQGAASTDGHGKGNGSDAAASAASSNIPTRSQPGPVTIAKTEPSFVISFPARMGGGSCDLNPFRSDRFGPVIDWFRTAVSWLTIVLFGWWASQQVKSWVKGVSQIRQAQGNAVVGGTGAQATALVAAGAITVAVTTFLVALIGWLGGDFGISSILSLVGTNPLSGAPGVVVWLLDRTFPVATMVAALTARVTWNFYASSIFAVCMTVIRFIVP